MPGSLVGCNAAGPRPDGGPAKAFHQRRFLMSWKMAWPGGRKAALTFSFDDGVRTDIRMIEILNRHGLKGTFHLNSGILNEPGTPPQPKGRLNRDEVADTYKGHEIATHGAVHAHLPMLTAGQRAAEILDDRRALEAFALQPVTGHSYSFGSYNREVMEQLKAYGIRYARTTASTGGFRLPEDWLAWHPTCHHSGMAECLEKALARKFSDAAGLFYVWTHTYELVDCWDSIEALCARAAGSGLFWPATNIEVYDYVEAWRRLEFSAAGDVVRNPSGIRLWAREWRGGEGAAEVPPGAVVKLRSA